MKSSELAPLVERAKKGDGGALNSVIAACRPLAQQVVAYYAQTKFGRTMTLDELEQAAETGLYKAVETFDESSGTRFLGHAVRWVRASLAKRVALSPAAREHFTRLEAAATPCPVCGRRVFFTRGPDGASAFAQHTPGPRSSAAEPELCTGSGMVVGRC